MSYDKLNVFLIETDSLSKNLVRYIANKFAEMYTRCLLIITIDYSEKNNNVEMEYRKSNPSRNGELGFF